LRRCQRSSVLALVFPLQFGGPTGKEAEAPISSASMTIGFEGEELGLARVLAEVGQEAWLRPQLLDVRLSLPLQKSSEILHYM
jgi:hypothetical protein